MRTFLKFIPLLALAACATTLDKTTAPAHFSAVDFANLPGWHEDHLDGFAEAMARSCDRMAKQDDQTRIRPIGTVGDFKPFCQDLKNQTAPIRTLIETHLRPWRVTVPGSRDGLFTGYYEASLRGSKTKTGPYQTPLRARPLDHVIVHLGDFKPEWAETRLTGQLSDQKEGRTLKPYPDRAGIEQGKIPATADRVLAWVDDPVDAFFLEIQGSGRVALTDGTVMHVGYDERNGHPYTAVGKILVERGLMAKKDVSMQTIRKWMKENPDAAQGLMQENKSYIFFREIGPDGPLGAENIPLTPLRSMAIDREKWSYGLPFYIDTDAPDILSNPTRLTRLMIGQDTGGAIKGAVRGDVFWGYGDTAEQTAGVMKSRGNLWVFLPRSLNP